VPCDIDATVPSVASVAALAANDVPEPNCGTHCLRFKCHSLETNFIERPWRSLKSECVHLHTWVTGSQARAGIGRLITFVNHQPPRSAPGGPPPGVADRSAILADRQVQAAACITREAVRDMGRSPQRCGV
jgi:hypothetical protein